ncbi:amidohydrolase family protein [Microbacterium sp.]|uniref:amidohydrolase family protein n=1 Tax=Microbacterium sp. TaxID=51671 RepID=UPI002FE1EAA5
MHAVTYFDGEAWRAGTAGLVDGRVRLSDLEPTADPPRLDGVISGGYTDHHVHLQLVDHMLLAGSTLGRVVDLGANPEVVVRLGAGAVDIAFAGAFLTPVGGYPSDREWAPAGSVREIADADAAAVAITEMADAGARRIKVASNAHAGPVFDDALFRTIVELAAARSLPVVAHTEGRGQAQRAARLGATQLAHAPFTERLDDAEIAEQAASVSWISTLAIHSGADLTIALDNVRRFHAAGGILRYGTDMGNGPTPVGLNAGELAALRDAGLDDTALLQALAPVDPLDPASVLLFFPGATPATADPLHARPLTADDLKV